MASGAQKTQNSAGAWRGAERSGTSIGAYLVFTAFLSGAIVMVIELLGSRIIGPPFGVSLFVWTSLITVALVSLAIGYWFGGRLADRKASCGSLFAIILLAGLFVLSIPLIKGVVIGKAVYLGLRAGSLASSAVLFGPPLFLLGMVSPYTVKLYMRDGMGVGRTVGWLYAVSTLGSVTGTVLTGFLLIPNLGVNNIIYLSAFILFGISAAYWAVFMKKPLAVALMALPAVFFFVPDELPSVIRPDGTSVSVVMSKDSPYGQIKVVDYSYGDTRYREFLLENIIQGAIDVTTGLPISKYTYYAEQLAITYRPGSERALVIGLGSGILPKRFSRYGISTDVVEIDRTVIDTASNYFSFDPGKHRIYIQDGRYFLKSPGEDYDIIFLDAFSGDTPPSHLVSIESFELMKKRLSSGGVLLINFIGESRTGTHEVPSMLKGTLKRVFSHVDVYAAAGYFSDTPQVVNLLFAAYDGERAIDGGFVPEDVFPPFIEDLKGLYSRKIPLEKTGGILFTDDHNPIDFYDLKTRERFRESIISSTDSAVFIH